MDLSLTSFFVHFSVSPKMYNKVRKDIPQISSHIYILSLSAGLLQTLMICLHYFLPSVKCVNKRGSHLEKGKGYRGKIGEIVEGPQRWQKPSSPPLSPFSGRVGWVGGVLLSLMILWWWYRACACSQCNIGSDKSSPPGPFLVAIVRCNNNKPPKNLSSRLSGAPHLSFAPSASHTSPGQQKAKEVKEKIDPQKKKVKLSFSLYIF